MTTLGVLSRQVEAAGRSALYSLCAYGLARPTARRWSLMDEVLIPAILALDVPGLDRSVIEEVAAAFPADHQMLAGSHLRCFPPVASQDAPGYETAYRGDDLFGQVEILADIGGFYRAHGVAAGGSERERPDHIVVELDFCAFISRKEAYAWEHFGTDEVEMCIEARTLFLRDHLGCWGASFGRRLALVAEHPFHRAVGGLTAGWIEADMAAAGVSPRERVDSPLPPPPLDGEGCAPCISGGLP